MMCAVVSMVESVSLMDSVNALSDIQADIVDNVSSFVGLLFAMLKSYVYLLINIYISMLIFNFD